MTAGVKAGGAAAEEAALGAQERESAVSVEFLGLAA